MFILADKRSVMVRTLARLVVAHGYGAGIVTGFAGRGLRGSPVGPANATSWLLGMVTAFVILDDLPVREERVGPAILCSLLAGGR